MKLCKDCENILSHISHADKCVHPSSKTEIDLVTGFVDFQYCRVMRAEEFPCKNDGILFQRKVTMSDKLKAKAEQLFGKYWS